MINEKTELELFVSKNWESISSYLDKMQSNYPVPIYTSVDIRESKNKFAPVDNNFYPAGFNNICTLDINATGPHFKKHIENIDKSIKNIGIISESNTRNTFYLDHLAMLKKCLKDAGYNVFIVSFDESLFDGDEKTLSLISNSGFDVVLHKSFVHEGIIKIQNEQDMISLCLCLMNNDQSAPLNIEWENIKSNVEPSPKLGWHKRTKANHFAFYNQVITEFCEHFKINTNLLEAKFKKVDGVDFSSKEGLDNIAKEVDQIISETNCQKVFVKADQGTYGMGIQVVGSGEEILNLNRKQRNKLDVGKNKKKFTSVLLQEGVETVLKWDDKPAEVSIYLVGGVSVGGFMRTNSLKDANSNLNARGMVFQKFCISEIRQDKEHKTKEALYSIIARLSSIAGGMEIQNSIRV